MSIHLDTTGRWEGALAKYGEGDESFISPKIIKRHGLALHHRRIRLLWRLETETESNSTYFKLSEGLPCDFLLGNGCRDDAVSLAEEIPIPRSPKSARSKSSNLRQTDLRRKEKVLY